MCLDISKAKKPSKRKRAKSLQVAKANAVWAVCRIGFRSLVWNRIKVKPQTKTTLLLRKFWVGFAFFAAAIFIFGRAMQFISWTFITSSQVQKASSQMSPLMLPKAGLLLSFFCFPQKHLQCLCSCFWILNPQGEQYRKDCCFCIRIACQSCGILCATRACVCAWVGGCWPAHCTMLVLWMRVFLALSRWRSGAITDFGTKLVQPRFAVLFRSDNFGTFLSEDAHRFERTMSRFHCGHAHTHTHMHRGTFADCRQLSFHCQRLKRKKLKGRLTLHANILVIRGQAWGSHAPERNEPHPFQWVTDLHFPIVVIASIWKCHLKIVIDGCPGSRSRYSEIGKGPSLCLCTICLRSPEGLHLT